MRKYEGCVLLEPGLTDETLAAELAELEKVMMAAGIGIVHKDLWGKRNLAYPIRKKTEGYYWIFYFEGEPQSVKRVSDSLRTRESLLRYLFLVRKKFPQFGAPTNGQSQSE